VDGPDALVGGGGGGIISKDTNTVRCSASDSQIGQPSVLRRRCATRTVRWLLLSIDRTIRDGADGIKPW